MYDLVTFGEAMVRLSPPEFMRLEQTRSLDLNVGGTEMNVAVGASRLGLKTAWVSKLPANPLGRMIRNKAREHGVDTRHIVWDPDGRAGLYFLEFGATPRPTSVTYDRRASAFSQIREGELDWSRILDGAKCLHLTGITPAVSPAAAEATREALRTAKGLGCRISLDMNYRTKLWSPAEARKVLVPLLEYVTVLITTEGDTRTILELERDNEFELAEALCDRFPLDVVALTVREGASVWQCSWTGIARQNGKTYTTRSYDIDIVDQVGRGDAFVSGFLYGLIGAEDVQRALDYGVAFAALKHSSPGDISWSTLEETEALLAGYRPGVSR